MATTWTPARTKPEHASASEEEFCGYNDCRHHADSHDYSTAEERGVPCTECVNGMCLRHEWLCFDKPGHPHDTECECWCHADGNS